MIIVYTIWVEAGSRQTIISYSPLFDALGPKEASHPLYTDYTSIPGQVPSGGEALP